MNKKHSFLSFPPIIAGQTVGIMAPSSSIDETRFAHGVEILHGMGLKTKIHPQTYAVTNQSAGTAAQKAAALHDLFIDKDVDIILGACGGNRAAHFLHLLDFDLIRTHAKPLGGFSDITALLHALHTHSFIESYHMPTVQNLGRIDADSLNSLLTLHEPKTWNDVTILRDGIATGKLLGGTLSMICSLIGTPHMPDYHDAILFIEDVNEELSRIDRMMWQLRESLPFNQLKGIIIGEFLNPADTGRPYGFTLPDIIKDHIQGLEIPVVMGAPIGHGTCNHALRFGAVAGITVQNGTLSLHYA
jgi:muramoyltetrapeptide carboxypeptidase